LTYGSAIIRRQFWEATMHEFILLGISVQFLDEQRAEVPKTFTPPVPSKFEVTETVSRVES
jgi:hypothetical protein